ncbi:hypothetical protein D3C71_2000550 [compost metagenome]
MGKSVYRQAAQRQQRRRLVASREQHGIGLEQEGMVGPHLPHDPAQPDDVPVLLLQTAAIGLLDNGE